MFPETLIFFQTKIQPPPPPLLVWLALIRQIYLLIYRETDLNLEQSYTHCPLRVLEGNKTAKCNVVESYLTDKNARLQLK